MSPNDSENSASSSHVPERLLEKHILEKIHNRVRIIDDLLMEKNGYISSAIQKEYSFLQKFLRLEEKYQELVNKIENNCNFCSNNLDLETAIIQMIQKENQLLREEQQEIYQEYDKLLYENNEENIEGISLEIRCGTGGREAALFAWDLLEMYRKFAARKKWRVQIENLLKTSEGGIREAVIIIRNKNAYSLLQFEAGVHRVQRVPETESMGRLHTSTATVAVLPELEKIADIQIDPKDIAIDVYRASGAGGQHVNTTESAVRITHIPTNTVVIQQDERSQHKNKEKAMSVLKTRVMQKMIQNQMEEVCRQRLSQIGKGERCEKIRTYNFPQDRVTDHRINYSVFNIIGFMNGEELEKICEQMQKLSSKTILEKYNII
jgi:peptide chain release factor 1